MATRFQENHLAASVRPNVPVESLRVSTFKFPTETLESDGTLEWESTTMVLVEACAAGKTGIGYTYAHRAAAVLIAEEIAPLIEGHNAMDVSAAFVAMNHELRNLGRPGLVSMAVSAVDCALWDLKARLLNLPLVSLLGQAQEEIWIYGSGGFTSYTEVQLADQLGDWVEQGILRVKMKVGRDPAADPTRVEAARRAVGDEAELFVDANGAYTLKQALGFADLFSERFNVTWFEEPVSSNNIDGLRLLRDQAPAPMDIAAGEYGWDRWDFKRLLDAKAVDVMMPDVTRCGGISGLMNVAALCGAYEVPLSAHCAPALSLHPCCAYPHFRHIEYFYDHVRIERMIFDGVLEPEGGALKPDLSRPGNGLEPKLQDVDQFRI